ncbi:MAG: hypothetical protein J3R72DRAFT_442623, partial [Linnemannia gamsii]
MKCRGLKTPNYVRLVLFLLNFAALHGRDASKRNVCPWSGTKEPGTSLAVKVLVHSAFIDILNDVSGCFIVDPLGKVVAIFGGDPPNFTFTVSEIDSLSGSGSDKHKDDGFEREHIENVYREL